MTATATYLTIAFMAAVNAVAIVGTVLNVRKSRACFAFWMISNAGAVAYSLALAMRWLQPPAWAIVVQVPTFALYFALAIWGWRAWGRPQPIERKPPERQPPRLTIKRGIFADRIVVSLDGRPVMVQDMGDTTGADAILQAWANTAKKPNTIILAAKSVTITRTTRHPPAYGQPHHAN